MRDRTVTTETIEGAFEDAKSLAITTLTERRVRDMSFKIEFSINELPTVSYKIEEIVLEEKPCRSR